MFLIRLLYSTNKNISRKLTNGISVLDENLSIEIKRRIEHHWASEVKSHPKNGNKSKFYVLSMFPYPSGQLHMGHVRVYTISDVIARYHRMKGHQVIHPMGWDAFGLPAENAAFEKQMEPDKWIQKNISYMKSQLKRLGCSFDWEREINTSNSNYYKWTQSIFLKLYHEGLIFQKKSLVNWDPIDQTVLADEQVDSNGYSWRSGAKVEKKLLKQWFVKSTFFSKSLLDGLNDPLLENWKDIILMQRHWIGDCNGFTFNFHLIHDNQKSENNDDILDQIQIWTKHPEFIPKYAAFIAISPKSIQHKLDLKIESFEHPNGGLCIQLATKAVNPFTKQHLPMFITNLVKFPEESDYYLGMPTVCDTDREFANFVNISYENSINDDYQLMSNEERINEQRRICQIANEKGIGGYQTSSRLRDWLISRQRYWGTPIPIVHCKQCGGPQPLPEHELPIELPKINITEKKGISPLLQAKEWLQTNCPKCKGPATRECDTLDTFFDSSWYYLRFLDSKNINEPFSKSNSYQSMPVDVYIGGKEHAVLHLYFARLMNHFLYSLGLVPSKEPFKKLLVQGMVMGKSYKNKINGQYLRNDQVDFTKDIPVMKGTNDVVEIGWEKMSKSKYNGMEPTEMFEKYGIDATRLLILADVAPQSNRHFSPETFPAFLKWQHRVWLTLQKFIKLRNEFTIHNHSTEKFEKQEEYFFDSRNYHLKQVDYHFQVTFQFNLLIMKLQGLTNQIRSASDEVITFSGEYERALALQIILISPLMPHFASELWSGFINAPNKIDKYPGEILWEKNVLEQPWPKLDDDYLMSIIIRNNKTIIASHKVPYKIFKNLTLNDALNYFNTNDEWQKYQKKASSNIIIKNLDLSNLATIRIELKKKVIDHHQENIAITSK